MFLLDMSQTEPDSLRISLRRSASVSPLREASALGIFNLVVQKNSAPWGVGFKVWEGVRV